MVEFNSDISANATVKELLKSVNIFQSYHKKMGRFFETQCSTERQESPAVADKSVRRLRKV